MRGPDIKAKNAAAAAGNFVFTFITAFVAIIAVLFVLIRLMGWQMFSVDSGSMAPRYPVDTLVVVQKIDPENIKVGDVITYVLNSNGVLVTHRVVEIDSAGRTFTTKGDANNTEDAPVLWDNVVGKVFLGFPKIGKPFRYLTDADNRPIVITLIAALFIASFAWDLIVRKKNKSKHNSDGGVSEEGGAFPETGGAERETGSHNAGKKHFYRPRH